MDWTRLRRGLKRELSADFKQKKWYAKDPKTPIDPERKKLLIRQGFLPSNDLIFDFEKYGMDAFLRERDYAIIHPVNRNFSQLIDNKAFLPILLQSKPELLPEFFLAVSKGKTNYYRGEEKGLDLNGVIHSALEKHNKLIVKPTTDGGGRNIWWITSSTVEEGISKLQSGGDFVINNVLENTQFLKSIFPNSLNTTRVVFFQKEDGEKKIHMMAQRFGSTSSKGVDNVSQGGMACSIDLNSGKFSKAYSFVNDSHQGWFDKHFETQAQIEGVIFPDWQTLKEKIKDIIDHLDYLEYAGLDLAITPAGIKVIEINSMPEPKLLQVGGPALIDEDFRNFLFSKGYRPKTREK